MHMIPIPFPKARAVICHEFDTAQPLGAFPEIEMREKKA